MPPKKKAGVAAASATPRPPLQSLPKNPNKKRALNDESRDAAPKSKRPSTRAASIRSSEASTATTATASNSTSATKKRQLSVIEQQPAWAFDVAGKWTIDASNLSRDLPWFNRSYPDGPPPFTLDLMYANNANHKKIGRQLWGIFQWGSWTGCMRLCPGHPYLRSHRQFYEECVLEKGVWAGPAPEGTPTWNFRWKVEDGEDGIVGGTDEYETQLSFSKAADGKLKVAGKMVVGGYKARKFSGVKTGSSSPPRANNDTVDHWWGKLLKDPFEESRLEICRGCKGGMDESDESETDQEEERDFIKELEENRKAREAEEAKDKLEQEKPWPTPMTGTWQITPRNGFSMDGEDPTAPRFMNIYEDVRDGNRQFWAEFQFGHAWSGIMRFCPKGALTGENFTVKEFEEACVLKEGIQAGPLPQGTNSWMIKWRGSLIEKYTKKERVVDDMTTNFTVKCGKDGKLILRGIIMEGCLVCFFTGIRTGDAEPRKANEPTLETLWEEKRWKEPSPPKIYQWKSPLPTECVQSPPEWAWDVLGKWKVEAPDVVEDMNAGENDPFTMTIYMANSKRPVALGRQLWATFSIGTKIQGCMRFIPLPENSRPKDDVTEFEKACKLGKNVWPGDSASAKDLSFQKWGLRWRAKHASGKNFRMSDSHETAFNFKRDEDGTLKISGVWVLSFQPHLWTAVKVEDGGVPDGTDTSVKTIWNKYAPK